MYVEFTKFHAKDGEDKRVGINTNRVSRFEVIGGDLREDGRKQNPVRVALYLVEGRVVKVDVAESWDEVFKKLNAACRSSIIMESPHKLKVCSDSDSGNDIENKQPTAEIQAL